MWSRCRPCRPLSSRIVTGRAPLRPAGCPAWRRVDQVLQQRKGLQGTNGALYFPWIIVADAGAQQRVVPPCGHVAGIYARSDQRVGVHKAPANEILEGVLDLSVAVTTAQQDLLNPARVNCLRAFPGRGIRVLGARGL